MGALGDEICPSVVQASDQGFGTPRSEPASLLGDAGEVAFTAPPSPGLPDFELE